MSYLKMGITDTGDCLMDDTGSCVKYHGEAERKIARATIEDHLSKVESQIEQRIGRKLTVSEARRGLNRPPLTEQEKLHSELTWQSMVAEKKIETPIVNPHEARLQKFLEDKEREEIGEREWNLRQDVKKWNEEQEAKKAHEQLMNDPLRVSALKHAKTALHEAKFNPNIDNQTLDTMERLVSYIQDGGDLQKAHNISHAVGQQIVQDMNVKMQQTSDLYSQMLVEQKMLSEKFNLPEAITGEVKSPESE